MAEGEGEGLQQRDERTGRAGEAGAGAALWDGGGGACGSEPAAGSSMGPQRLRHHPGGGASSGGDGRGSVRLQTRRKVQTFFLCKQENQWPMPGRLGRTAAKIA